MSKKSNIEELFKDSMDDFRVDPPKETSKKILLALFWSNIIHHYKGAIIVSVAAALAGVGALFYFNQSTENTSSAKVENLNASNAVASMPSSSPSNNSTAFSKQYNAQKTSVEKSVNDSKQVNSSVASNSSLSTKANKVNTKESTQSGGLNSSSLVSYDVISIEKTSKKLTKNKIKKSSTTDKKRKETDNVENQKDELVGAYGCMGEVGSAERAEYDKNLKEGGFPNLTGESESPSNATETKTDSSVDSLPKEALKESLAAVDSIKKDSTVAKLDSAGSKKKLPISFFAGVGASGYNWQLSNELYQYSPSISAELNVGAQYKSFMLFTGVGYHQQTIALENRVWTTLDSELVQVPITYFEKTIQKDSTYYLWKMQGYENSHSAKDGRSISLNYLYVPLQLAYAYRFQKHQLLLKAGVGMHFLTSSSQTTVPADTSGLISIETPLFEPNKFVLDFNIHLNYGYNFTPHFLVMAGVTIKQNRGDIARLTDQNIDPPFRPLGIGSSLQLIYKF
jgi:hypothetical protein